MKKTSRALTHNEITEAQKVYGNTINYEQVRVICGKYIPIQLNNYVMTPNGSIYWPDAPDDLVTFKNGLFLDTYIHEMMHIYQHQRGIKVFWHGLILQALKFATFTLYNPYAFNYDDKKAFSDYNIEQQGDIAIGIYRGLYPNTINY